MKYTIYTDGGCRPNRGNDPGGWACIIIIQETQQAEYSGFHPATTNNRMEIQAVIEGLSRIPEAAEAEVYSDSAYVVNCFRDGWYRRWRRNGWVSSAGTPVENKDLWEKLLDLVEKRQITFCKTKGHADDPLNNRCDELATAALKQGRQQA